MVGEAEVEPGHVRILAVDEVEADALDGFALAHDLDRVEERELQRLVAGETWRGARGRKVRERGGKVNAHAAVVRHK